MTGVMSRRRAVAVSLREGLAGALTGVRVRGFDEPTERPERVSAGGDVVGQDGGPGTPEIDLSPPQYNYDHVFTLDVAAPPGRDSDVKLDAILLAIGAWIAANRTLNGLCTWLDARAPEQDETSLLGTTPQRWATVDIVASYTIASPLG